MVYPTACTSIPPTGKKGLRNGIYNNHQSAVYREKEPEKYLYRLMAKPGVIAYYVGLAVLDSLHDTGTVLVLEAITASFFGTSNTVAYRALRRIEMPLGVSLSLRRLMGSD